MMKKFICKRSEYLFVFIFIVILLAGCQKENENIITPQDQTQIYNFSKPSVQLKNVMDVQNKHTNRLFENEYVIGTATSQTADGKLTITILTKSDKKQDLPTMLDGVPVVIDNIGEVYALGLTKRYERPVPIGVSIGNINECASGTLGCAVEKLGVRYILSNNHVLARENTASEGEAIVQPGRYDNKPLCALRTNDIIGTLSSYKAIVFSKTAQNVIDAAIAITTTGNVSSSTMSVYYGTPSSTTIQPVLGANIMKVGRTTSFTTGTITGINVTINVSYSSGVARFVQQIMTSKKFCKAGDSGSLVVSNPDKNSVGLLFAGSNDGTTFLNPIDDVLKAFGVTIVGE